MRRSLALLLPLFLALSIGAVRAFAVPDPAALLESELERRRDNDYAGTLDKTQKKELKAVNKAIAVFAKPAETLAAQVASAIKVAKGIEKAFPAEFPKALASLQQLLQSLADQLRVDAENAWATLAAAVPGIKKPQLQSHAEAERVAAREDLDLAAAATDPLAALTAVKNAVKEIVKGLAFAAKDPHVETVSAMLDFSPGSPESFVAQNTTVTYRPSDTILFVDGNSLKGGRFVDVQITSSNLDPITGPGTYTVSAVVAVGSDPVTIDASYSTNNATLEVTTLDTVNKHIVASFSFTATSGAGPGAPTVTASQGVVDVKKFGLE